MTDEKTPPDVTDIGWTRDRMLDTFPYDEPPSTRYRGLYKQDIDDMRRACDKGTGVQMRDGDDLSASKKASIVDGKSFPCIKGNFIARHGNKIHVILCPEYPFCDCIKEKCNMDRVMHDASPGFSKEVLGTFSPNAIQSSHAVGYVRYKESQLPPAMLAPLYRSRAVFFIFHAINAVERSSKATPDRPTMFDLQRIFMFSGISNDTVRDLVHNAMKIGLVTRKEGKYTSYHLRDTWPCAFGTFFVGWKEKHAVPVICSNGNYPDCFIDGKCCFDGERKEILAMIEGGEFRELVKREYGPKVGGGG